MLSGKAIRSKHIFPNDHDDPVDGYVLIHGEKIESIIPYKSIPVLKLSEKYNIIDYSDLYVFPGIIDHNVHLNSTYEDSWNDAQNITKMAAQGGITTIIDGPLMNRSDDNQAMTINLRYASLANKIFVDVGVLAYLDNKFLEILENSGVIGFKGYLSPPFLNTIPKLNIHALYKIKKSMEEVQLPCVFCLHCEEANERDLFMPSPLRAFDKKARLDENVDIKNLRAFGGGHQGVLNDELSSNTSNNEEANDKVFDLILETNKLKNQSGDPSPTTADLKKFSFLEAITQDVKYVHELEYAQFKGGDIEDELKEEGSRNFDSMNLNFNSSLEISEISEDFSHKNSENSIDQKLKENNEEEEENKSMPSSSLNLDSLKSNPLKKIVLGSIHMANTEKEIELGEEEQKEKDSMIPLLYTKQEIADSENENDFMIGSCGNYSNIYAKNYSQSPEIVSKKKKEGILERRLKSKTMISKDVLFKKKANTSDPKAFFNLKRINTHKELDNLETQNQEKQICRQYKNFLYNHPLAWETSGVNLILKVFKNIKNVNNCSILFTNFSSSSLAYLVRDERKKNPNAPFFVDTSIPYIFFNMEMIKDGQTKFKLSPPIRDKPEQKLIIKSLRKGVFDTISSYHLQTPTIYKSIEGGNFRKAFDGASCIGFNLPVVWTRFYLYEKEKINKTKNPLSMLELDKSINKVFKIIIKTMSIKPAEILKIAHQKGEIASGKDADLFVWNPFVVKKITKDDLLLKYPKLHLLRGYKVYGEVQATFLRGEIVFQKEGNDKDFFQRGKILRRGVNI